MDFANEAYVRLYVRDTVTWKRLQWDGQNCTTQLLRRAYPTGAIELGGIEPWEAAAQLCGAPEDAARRGVAKMLELGVATHDGDRLVFPRYAEANDTAASDKQRAKEYRARQRASRNVMAESQNVMDPSRRITERHDRHDASRTVTEANGVGAADLSQTEQSIRLAFQKRYEQATQSIPSQAQLSKASSALAGWVAETCRLRKVRPETVIPKLLDGFFASSLAQSKGYPPAFLAANPLEYFEPRASNGTNRYAGPSRVATQAEYEADKTEKAPWET